ncbi:MAG: flagellar hook-basal body complex protein FliE [Steroidobacteraceae bacterium]
MSSVEIDRVLSSIRALQSTIGANGPAAPAVRPHAAPQGSAANEFGALLRQGIDAVNRAQDSAGKLATAFEKGVPGVDLPAVMVEMQKASISFRAVAEVRNRFINAYQEIMNMPL